MIFRIYHVRFGYVFRPFVANCHDHTAATRIVCLEVRMKQLRELGAALVLTAAIFTPAIVATQAPPPGGGLPDLVGALKMTPGVLGVDAGQTISGKQVIFAWFENKQAALNWYNSDVHRKLMNGFSSGSRRPDGPLAGIKDDSGPILAIASITLDMAAMKSGDLKAATRQIAIELYAPLPGGLAAGGRFAPSSVKVPGLIEVPMSGAPPSKDKQ
jgi:hypothetical protein